MIIKSDKKSKQKKETYEVRIDNVERTSDTLSDRAGLALFTRYLSKIGIYSMLEKYFGSLRKSKKGTPIENIFKQLFCYFTDGTSLHLTRFDDLSKDRGYAETIENGVELMLSSHSAKRFFKSFSPVRTWQFRKLLQDLFIWRLRLEKPDTVVLGIDTMVMDNNDAKEREGVSPTYKRVKGFQPLQIYWDSYIIDAVFRGGKNHSNHSDTVIESLTHIIRRIRKEYSKDVPIIIRADAGFFDEKNFRAFEDLNVAYMCGGRVYDDIRTSAESIGNFTEYEGKENIWEFVDFMDKRKSWYRERRAIYLKPFINDEGETTLPFARETDRIIYTNLGIDEELNELFIKSGKEEYFKAERIIESYHNRGNDELINRALKEFGTVEMPFRRFLPNAAFYYSIVLSFFLYESFKRDVSKDIIDIQSYPTTFRRILIDFAGILIHTGRRIILKVSQYVYERLNIPLLWERCNNPPLII